MSEARRSVKGRLAKWAVVLIIANEIRGVMVVASLFWGLL